jgi:hypothetical protein
MGSGATVDMNKKLPSKQLRTIRSAIENEYYLDVHNAEQMGISKEHVIPQTIRYMTFLRTRSGKVLALVVRRLWWLGFIVLISDILRSLILRARMGYRVLVRGDSIFISAERYGSEAIRAYSELDAVTGACSVIFTSPMLMGCHIATGGMSCFQVYTNRELAQIVWQSIRTYVQLVLVSRDPLFRLHLSRVWRLTINCALLDRLNTLGVETVVHTNHYDSNAVVIHEIFKGRIVLVQHGEINREVVPPCRIRPPAKLYTLNADAEQIFRSCIFIDPDAHIEVTPYRKRLVFSETVFDGFTVLIASRPADFEAEIRFISALRLRGLDDVRLIVKPHPLLSKGYPHKFRTQNRVEVWLDRYVFPRAHVLVCGLSTMGMDYAAYGIPVLDVYMPNVIDAICELRLKVNSIAADRCLTARGVNG